MTISLSAIFCDDIREEKSGKLILIGTYPDDIIASEIPLTLPLSIWARLRGLPTGLFDFKLNIYVNSTQQQEATGTFEVLPGQIGANLILTGVPVSIQEPGEIELRVTSPSDDLVLSEFINVRRME